MRTVKEWIGATDDTDPPLSVTTRLIERAKGCCQSCLRRLMAGEEIHRDHIVRLRDGGENRECNLQILCKPCHGVKTAAEATAGAKVRAQLQANYGIKREYRKRPMQGRGFVQKPKRTDQLPLPPRRMLWPVGNSDGD